jgi:hypothetical protein
MAGAVKRGDVITISGGYAPTFADAPPPPKVGERLTFDIEGQGRLYFVVTESIGHAYGWQLKIEPAS